MKESTRRMLEIAKKVSPAVVCDYAKRLGWIELRIPRTDAKAYRSPGSEAFQILIPFDLTYVDYPNGILTAVHYLAEVQDRTMGEILDELAQASVSGSGSSAANAGTVPSPAGSDAVSKVIT